MVQLFIDGGGFMWPILFIFIIGFVFVGERLYHLLKGLSANEAFANSVAQTLASSGVEAAKTECSTRVAHPRLVPRGGRRRGCSLARADGVGRVRFALPSSVVRWAEEESGHRPSPRVETEASPHG